MTMRTTRRTVTIQNPFKLEGFDYPQPAGVYVVETDEEMLDTVTSIAFRRTATRIEIYPRAGSLTLMEAVPIDPEELELVLGRDTVRDGPQADETSR